MANLGRIFTEEQDVQNFDQRHGRRIGDVKHVQMVIYVHYKRDGDLLYRVCIINRVVLESVDLGFICVSSCNTVETRGISKGGTFSEIVKMTLVRTIINLMHLIVLRHFNMEINDLGRVGNFGVHDDLTPSYVKRVICEHYELDMSYIFRLCIINCGD